MYTYSNKKIDQQVSDISQRISEMELSLNKIKQELQKLSPNNTYQTTTFSISQNKKFLQGFCYGDYEKTVDIGPRIHLPSEILKVLKENNVRKLWRNIDTTFSKMILCPSKNFEDYVKYAEQHFFESLGHDDAYRKFISSGDYVIIKSHGKISISSTINRHLNIEKGDSIVIVGIGLWYEVWKVEDWIKLGQ